MKKLLLSVVALMIATLLFSLNDSTDDVQEDLSQDNEVRLEKKADIAS